jgi:hypothetical protein
VTSDQIEHRKSVEHDLSAKQTVELSKNHIEDHSAASLNSANS